MIKHHPFFEALGTMEEKTPEWNSVFAGLSVMRLLDRLAESREPSPQPDPHQVDSSRRAVQAVKEGDPSRVILLRILDRAEGPLPFTGDLGADLISYGRALDLAARWTLAADVFQMVIGTFSPRTNPDLIIEASTLLGAAARNSGDWETSERAYTRAEHLAESIGDRAGSLTAQIGMASSEMFRGNLQGAETALERISSEANALNLEKVEAIALHARASAAHLKGDLQRTIHLAYRSLELTTNPTGRDRLIADIAAAYGALGMNDTARHGYSIVVLTSSNQWVRWQSMLNLMALALEEDDEATFDKLVHELEPAALDPRLKTYFMMFKAIGSRRFHRQDADYLFEDARQFASRNKLHQLTFEIEDAMSKPAQSPDIEPTPELAHIAEVLEHLHDEATSDR